MPGINSETQKKVQSILAMKPSDPKPKQQPVCVNKIISTLERFENKIEVALYLSK